MPIYIIIDAIESRGTPRTFLHDPLLSCDCVSPTTDAIKPRRVFLNLFPVTRRHKLTQNTSDRKCDAHRMPQTNRSLRLMPNANVFCCQRWFCGAVCPRMLGQVGMDQEEICQLHCRAFGIVPFVSSALNNRWLAFPWCLPPFFQK